MQSAHTVPPDRIARSSAAKRTVSPAFRVSAQPFPVQTKTGAVAAPVFVICPYPQMLTAAAFQLSLPHAQAGFQAARPCIFEEEPPHKPPPSAP